MSMSEAADDTRTETRSPETRDGKLPYEKPAVRCEGVFETRALSCGKTSVAQPQCAVNMRNS